LKNYGNPSEYHRLGRDAKIAIENSRTKIASFFGAKPGEIVFTGCATESINLSHKGLIESLGQYQEKLHIITTKVEHKAVLETCQHLESLGWADVSYLPVDKYGLVDLLKLKKAIKPTTVLISIIYVNNEVGTINPISEIGHYIKWANRKRKQKIYFHSDATQAVSFLNCDVDFLGVDFLSFTGHKLHAPKGVGGLFMRSGTNLLRQIDGGAQEGGLRSGTENVASIVGLGKAIELIRKSPPRADRPLPEKNKNGNYKSKTKNLRDELIAGVIKIPGVRLSGHPEKRAPHIASFIVDGAEGEAIVLKLSDLGIYISSGSACTSADLTASHVLSAMGIPPQESHGSIRFSLARDTKKEEIDYLLRVLPKIISDLRTMAPKL
jgi:cysteine desulfurase